jgi:hypothetical protein
MMHLEHKHLEALEKAERWMFHMDFCPYLELKALLSDPAHDARDRFKALFTTFYGLNAARVNEMFKKRYFEIMFSYTVLSDEVPNYTGILHKLHKIQNAMHFSFVSKLVAMHRESYPIYDRHVLAFFNMKAPSTSMDQDSRIERYIDILNLVRRSYIEWAKKSEVKQILKRLKSRDKGLLKCHDVRLMDFLVWKVGNQKLMIK